MKIVDSQKIKLSNDETITRSFTPQKNMMLLILGTREGKVVIYKYGSLNPKMMYQSKAGLAYGGISSIDVTTNGSDIVAGSEAGEVIQFDLYKRLNED